MLTLIFLERTLESHESVLSCYYRMEHENERKLVLQLNYKMFDIFKDPEVNLILNCYLFYYLYLFLFCFYRNFVSIKCWILKNIRIIKVEPKLLRYIMHKINYKLSFSYFLFVTFVSINFP